jgi:hypothetical protein
MRTVTPRISSEEVEGRRDGFGGEQVKSKELTPIGTGPTEQQTETSARLSDHNHVVQLTHAII